MSLSTGLLIALTVCHKRSILNYLQALCVNLRVDFSGDSINAVKGHFISLRKNSKNRILILYENFSQTAAKSRGEPGMHAINTGLSKIGPQLHDK